MFCHWPTLNLHFSNLPPEYFFIFPLPILRLKCTYDIGCVVQDFSSCSLKNSWVLCHSSRIYVILVLMHPNIWIHLLLKYWDVWSDRLSSVRSANRGRMDGLSHESSWACGGFSLMSPGRIHLIFRILSQRFYLDHIIIYSQAEAT